MPNVFTTRQAVNSATSGSTISVPITAPTSGNILVVWVASAASTGTVNRHINSVTCTNVTNFSGKAATTSTKYSLECQIGNVGASAGTSVDVAMSGALSAICVSVSEFSASVRDASGGQPGSGTTPDTGTFFVNLDHDLVIVAEMHATGTAPSAQPAGYTPLTGRAASTLLYLQPNYNLDGPAPGGQSGATWTIGSAVWLTAVITQLRISNWLIQDYWWQRTPDSSGVF